MLSFYPCDLHGKRVEGRLGALYPTLLRRGARLSRKLRVCTTCHDAMLKDHHLEDWMEDPTDLVVDGLTCYSCNKVVSDPSELDAFFVTSYRRGEERHDFFARYCRACGDEVEESLQLSL